MSGWDFRDTQELTRGIVKAGELIAFSIKDLTEEHKKMCVLLEKINEKINKLDKKKEVE
jgi:hypothetical protein